jgi:hypothetical protein
VGIKALASPGELINLASRLLGVPNATIAGHDRNLSAANLRSKSGRGTSAAKVTPRDAAYLLTAVLGSAKIKETLPVMRRYEATRVEETKIQSMGAATWSSPGWGWQSFNVPEMASLPPNHSFLQAFEALIASASSRSLDRVFQDAEDYEEDDLPEAFVEVQYPVARAGIRITGGNLDGRTVVYGIHCEGSSSPGERRRKWRALWKELYSDLPADGDLKQRREISSKTIFAIGRKLAAKEAEKAA